MKKTITLLALTAATTACSTGYPPEMDARRGLAPVHVPVVERQHFAYDVPVAGAGLASGSAAALDGWFSSLGLAYGDHVYLDGPNASVAFDDVARVAGRYGLLVEAGAPVTQGAIEPGTARVVVSRAHASVPGCPDWRGESHGNPANLTMPGFGCSVNANLAAMVANPEDLIHGRPGAATVDARTSARAVRSYRDKTPTGDGNLKTVTTGGGK